MPEEKKPGLTPEQRIMGVPDAVIDTVAAAAWLSERFRRPVLPSQIANWASRGKLARLSDEDGKPQRDPRGRQLYRLDELEACAVKMFAYTTPEQRIMRARIAAHARWGKQGITEEYIKQLVESAPPLSPEQIERLRALLPSAARVAA